MLVFASGLARRAQRTCILPGKCRSSLATCALADGFSISDRSGHGAAQPTHNTGVVGALGSARLPNPDFIAGTPHCIVTWVVSMGP